MKARDLAGPIACASVAVLALSAIAVIYPFAFLIGLLTSAFVIGALLAAGILLARNRKGFSLGITVLPESFGFYRGWIFDEYAIQFGLIVLSFYRRPVAEIMMDLVEEADHEYFDDLHNAYMDGYSNGWHAASESVRTNLGAVELPALPGFYGTGRPLFDQDDDLPFDDFFDTPPVVRKADEAGPP